MRDKKEGARKRGRCAKKKEGVRQGGCAKKRRVRDEKEGAAHRQASHSSQSRGWKVCRVRTRRAAPMTSASAVLPCIPASSSRPAASGPSRHGLSKSDARAMCRGSRVTAASDHSPSLMPPHSWLRVSN